MAERDRIVPAVEPCVPVPPTWAPPVVREAPATAEGWAEIPGRSLSSATDGAPLRQTTLVRAAWHGGELLVCFECADDDAWGTHLERDAPLWTEEAVEVFLAPGGDTPRRYVEIEVSPRSALFDAWVDNPDGARGTMRVDAAWDWPGIRWRAGRRDELAQARDDWWVEIALPLRAVVPEPAPLPALWRANFYRIDRPRRRGLADEYGAWSPTFRNPPDFHVPQRFGLLRAPR